MTQAHDDQLDKLKEAVHVVNAGYDSHDIPDRPPAGESDGDEMLPARLRYEPFPVKSLPKSMRTLVMEGTKAIGCDPAMIALPALSVAGAAIGGSRAVELKPGWIEFPTIWAGVIAKSGSAKSPAMKLATEPLHKMQGEAFDVFDEELAEYKAAAQRHKKLIGKWDGEGVGPTEPIKPPCRRLIVSDVTLEGLAPILQENQDGVLLERDELGAWLKSFGQYKGGLGGDVEAWLSIFDSAPITIDRKTGRETIHVRSPHVSICGTIQPAAIERALGEQHFENGLAARILMAHPPTTCPPFTKCVVSEATLIAWAKCIENLWALKAGADDNENPTPILMRMTPEAERVWVDLHNELADRIATADDRLSAVLSKMRAYAARLALIHHLTDEAGRGAALAKPTLIGIESVESACTLARWFAHEAERIYSAFSETEQQRECRDLVELIERRGGSISVRDLTHNLKRFRGDPGGAKAALDDFVEHGFGVWKHLRPGPKGGAPSKVFVLNTTNTNAATPSGGPESGGSGGGVDGPHAWDAGSEAP